MTKHFECTISFAWCLEYFFMAYRLKVNLRFGFQHSLNARTKEREDFEERTEWKSSQDILTMNWKSSLLVKIYCYSWPKTALHRLQCFLLLFYGNTRISAAPELRAATLIWPAFPLYVRHLIEGGAYSGLLRLRTTGSWSFELVLSKWFFFWLAQRSSVQRLNLSVLVVLGKLSSDDDDDNVTAPTLRNEHGTYIHTYIQT